MKRRVPGARVKGNRSALALQNYVHLQFSSHLRMTRIGNRLSPNQGAFTKQEIEASISLQAPLYVLMDPVSPVLWFPPTLRGRVEVPSFFISDDDKTVFPWFLLVAARGAPIDSHTMVLISFILSWALLGHNSSCCHKHGKFVWYKQDMVTR